MGPGTFGYNPNINRPTVFTIVQTDQKPFIDPDKGIEQFFDEYGPGPTEVDRANWDAATKSKTDMGKRGFPEPPSLKERVSNFFSPLSSIKGTVSKFFENFLSSLKSTLFIIILTALVVSFAFFYLKTIALRGKI